ncbi:adhesion G-protein coupled receptor F3-like [Hyla sarda]|uniref:adhesion G-protein coupled receptor F3-like n=1 Tax=Hyla sarda TaxID=327740 RepID=UPI0024C3BCFB|nr:adhesion G-protein coupled receptor F3-like [Hyla sarda]
MMQVGEQTQTMVRPDLCIWTSRTLYTGRMRNTFSALFLCLMIGTSQGYWSYETRQSQSFKELETEFGKERVKRQLSSQNEYYYGDITLEGYDVKNAIANYPSLSASYTLLINSTLSLTLTQITITTDCNVTDTGKMCVCKNGYTWNITVCYTYSPCNNSAPFCSCLIIPDYQIPYCESPKNISDYRVHMKGNITLNKTFTKDLLDPTSVTYKALESNITLTLLNVYTQTCDPLDVSVKGFSPGSVVANYSMEVSGPLSASQISSSNTMVLQSLPDAISSQLSTAGVAYIEPMDLEVNYLAPIHLTCQINETVNNVNWSLTTTSNNTNMIYSGGNNVDISVQIQPKKTISVLHIKTADVWWEGTYICMFFNDTLVHKAKAMVNVTLLPAEITVNPLQKTLTPGDTSGIVLECCVPFDGEEYNVSWTYNNVTQSAQPGNRIDMRCYSLAPWRPTNDTNFTCTFTNIAGQQKESYIPVAVIQAGDTYCTTDTNYGVIWNITKAGMSAIATCPPGKSGYLTRDCSANGTWLMVEDDCINQILKSALASVQTLEDGLGNSQEKVPGIIQQMSNSSGTSITNTAEVSTLVSILETISRIASDLNNSFDFDVVTGFLEVASNLTDPNYTTLWKGPKSPPASTVLLSVERFCQLLRVDNGSFDIDLENIQLKGSAYERGQTGQDYMKTFDQLGVSMSIDQHTISSLLQNNEVKITSVAFTTIGSLLPSKSETFMDSQLNSHVQSTSIRLSDSTSVSSSISMSFKTNLSDRRYSQHCVFWDFSLQRSGGDWSDVGCTSRVENNTTYCSCSHLTSFAVLMSIDVVSLPLIEEITYVGLGVSIFSLFICVLVEWYVWKVVVRSNISYFRHMSLVNIAMSLLCADICFLSSSFPSVTTTKLICLSITFLNHFFYLALFFWTFAQSIMLLHQLIFVFHHLRKTVYISLSFLVGYLIPAIIAAGTFMYFYPKGRYRHETLCWLNPASGAIYAFAIPAGSIIVFNFLTLLVVISKLSRPSVSDKNHPEDRDTAKSILKAILVLTPVFGLTWSFGFALLTDLDYLSKQIFTYGFSAMNAFQGFFILITCITERKVRDVLFNRRSSSQTSTTATTMSTTEDRGKMTASVRKKK